MSDNKYGLDFNISKLNTFVKKELGALESILKNLAGDDKSRERDRIDAQARKDREAQKKEDLAAEERLQAQKPKEPEPINFTLKNAMFLPEDDTNFNKKCKIKVDIVPDNGETPKGQVTFALWGLYNGKEYDLQHQIKTECKSSTAETDITLYYIDPYYTDVYANKKQGCTCEYFLKASMKGAKPIEKSGTMKMPLSKVNKDVYGGYELKKDDNDNKKIWAGGTKDDYGHFVYELQKDLLRLGYWISKPEDSKYRGMNVDGGFGESVENAVKLFQFEHYMVDSQGNIDKAKKEKVTGVVDKDTAELIKNKIKNIGNKKWDRPGHKPSTEWEEPAGTGDYAPNKTFKPDTLFYQLPPSEGYYRRGTVEWGSRHVSSKTKTKKDKNGKDETITLYRCKQAQVLDDDDCKWIMVDSWGTKEQVDFLKNLGDTWLKSQNGKPRTVKDDKGKEIKVTPFTIGDISFFNGGPTASHSGHKDGNSADLNAAEKSSIFSPNKYTHDIDRELTLAFCRLIEGDVKQIFNNCHYIISNIEKAAYADQHHHHLHFDGPISQCKSNPIKFTTCALCTYFKNCKERIYRVRDSADIEWNKADHYNPNNSYETGKQKGPGICALKDANNNPLVIAYSGFKKLYPNAKE